MTTLTRRRRKIVIYKIYKKLTLTNCKKKKILPQPFYYSSLRYSQQSTTEGNFKTTIIYLIYIYFNKKKVIFVIQLFLHSLFNPYFIFLASAFFRATSFVSDFIYLLGRPEICKHVSHVGRSFILLYLLLFFVC